MLGAALLAIVNSYIHNEEYLENAKKSMRFSINHQNEDGSWFYGKQLIQNFIDHYHTAYILESLENIRRYSKSDFDIKPVIQKVIDFYIKSMFTKKGAPKFYKNSLYPVESHCSGAAMKALCVLSGKYGREYFNIAVKVAEWAIQNMYDTPKGYFYYQKRKYWTNKINYLHLSQSWMFVGLAYLLYYGKKYEYTFD